MRCMLPLHDFSFAREQGRKPVGVENIDERVDQNAALEAPHPGPGASHRELPGTCHVDDRIVRPVRDDTAPTPGGREPGGSGVRDAPDAKLFSFDLSSNERRLEWDRRAEAPELVG